MLSTEIKKKAETHLVAIENKQISLEKGRQEVIQLIQIDNPEINNPTLQDILAYRQGTILIKSSSAPAYLIHAVRYLLTIPAILNLINNKKGSFTKVIIKKDGTEKKIHFSSQTALSSAVKVGHWGIVSELLMAGASYQSLLRIPNILMRAVKQSSLIGVKCMLSIPEIKKTINTPDGDGNTPILQAALNNQWQMVRELKKAGATETSLIEYREPRSKNTMLMKIAQTGTAEGMQYCLKIPELFELLNAQNQYGQTALFLAIYNANEKCIDELLSGQKNLDEAKQALKQALDYHFGDLTILMLALEGSKLRSFKCFTQNHSSVQSILSLHRDTLFLEKKNQQGQT